MPRPNDFRAALEALGVSAPRPAAATTAPGRAARGAALAVAHARGAILFAEGEPCEGVLVLATGSVRVVRASGSGRELVVERVRAGEACGTAAACLLGGFPYPASAVAETAVSGWLLPPTLVGRLLDDSPLFRRRVLKLLAGRVRDLVGLAAAAAFAPLPERLAAALLGLAPEPGGGVAVTHQRLADEVGSVREIVSRILAEWAADGVVALGRRRIRVLRPDRLAALARGEAGGPPAGPAGAARPPLDRDGAPR